LRLLVQDQLVSNECATGPRTLPFFEDYAETCFL